MKHVMHAQTNKQIVIIVMAAASGLDLLEKEERNPLYTSSDDR
ncbi:hypothetical protein ACVPOR_11995 [Staphylococcus aureus]